ENQRNFGFGRQNRLGGRFERNEEGTVCGSSLTLRCGSISFAKHLRAKPSFSSKLWSDASRFSLQELLLKRFFKEFAKTRSMTLFYTICCSSRESTMSSMII